MVYIGMVQKNVQVIMADVVERSYEKHPFVLSYCSQYDKSPCRNLSQVALINILSFVTGPVRIVANAALHSLEFLGFDPA
jgi:hypothetical protein